MYHNSGVERCYEVLMRAEIVFYCNVVSGGSEEAVETLASIQTSCLRCSVFLTLVLQHVDPRVLRDCERNRLFESRIRVMTGVRGATEDCLSPE